MDKSLPALTCPSFKGQYVLTLGMGRSGLQTAHALARSGAHVFAWDDQPDKRMEANLKGIDTTPFNKVPWGKLDHMVLSPGIPHTQPEPHPWVRQSTLHGIQPISDIECFFRINAIQDRCVIGITGTNGKSTTAALLDFALKKLGVPTALGGNFGIPVLGLPHLPPGGVYVLELSSYQLELTPSLNLDRSILLNITPHHLIRHGTFENYVQAKGRIFKNTTKPVYAIYNQDDPSTKDLTKTMPPFGKEIPLSMAQQESAGAIDAHSLPIRAAYETLCSLGHEPQDSLNALDNFPNLPHRQEIVYVHKNIQYINDSKSTNLEALTHALRSQKGLPTFLIMGGYDEGIKNLESLSSELTCVQKAFLIGDSGERFDTFLKGKVPTIQSHTLGQALEYATQEALTFKDPCSVLLSPGCPSFDQFRDFEERGLFFSHWVTRRYVQSRSV
jgi:UDP-N-acetylmuramoylalanine--D-glutamate ligase